MPPSRSTNPSSVVTSDNRKRQLPEHPSSPADDKLPALDVGDAEYKRFLTHLRLDGKSYVFETPVGGSAPPLRVKYEGDERPGATAVTRQRRQASGSKRRGSGEANKKRKTDEASSTERRRVSFRPRTHISSSTVGIGGSLVDQDYQMFLNNIKAHGSLIMLKWRNNASVLYEDEEKEEENVHEQQEEKVTVTENKELREETNIYPLDDSLQPSGSPGLQEPEDRSYFAEILQHKPSLFRNKLLKVLRKPFDQKEYECMMSHIRLRKPMVRYKHLRFDSIPYTTDELGYSYLDHYPDIARCIESALDDYHKNFILRGFFFWLKNLGASDAFKPWIPAIPESRYAIHSDNGKMILSLQLDVSDDEEAKEKEGKETYEEKEGRNGVNILYEEEKKVGVVVKEEVGTVVKEEGMPTETGLCGIEDDVCPSEIEIKPDLNSLQSSNLLGLRASKRVGYSVTRKKFQMTSLFQSRLMSVLERPFDQVEYENLMSVISLRKPAREYKHSLGDFGPCEKDKLGYSYLDHYPDLARKIRAANPKRILFLLRGFFFWLQNLCHEDAYMPWEKGHRKTKLLPVIDISKDSEVPASSSRI